MNELKSIDYKLLWELLKNSRRSDRELARALGISQPTATRRRANIEKNFIDGYTAIPKWKKIGFEIVAFTFVKARIKYVRVEEREALFKKAREWMSKQSNVVFVVEGQGMGWDGICISFHKNYSDFMEFIKKHNSELSNIIIESQSFVADLNPATIVKPFHLKYLSEAK